MALGTRPRRLDYGQYLVSSQINYTLTNFAEHSLKFSHDQLNRLLRDDKLTPHVVWEQTRGQLIQSPNGYLLFDDTVADKNYSRSIDLVRRQWSGNTHSVIRGIGIVTCIYVNPETEQFWRLRCVYEAGGACQVDFARTPPERPTAVYREHANLVRLRDRNFQS